MRQATWEEWSEAIGQLSDEPHRIGAAWRVETVYVEDSGEMIIVAHLYIASPSGIDGMGIPRDATRAEWDEAIGRIGRDPTDVRYLGAGWRINRVAVYNNGGRRVTAELYLRRRDHVGEPT